MSTDLHLKLTGDDDTDAVIVFAEALRDPDSAAPLARGLIDGVKQDPATVLALLARLADHCLDPVDENGLPASPALVDGFKRLVVQLNRFAKN